MRSRRSARIRVKTGEKKCVDTRIITKSCRCVFVSVYCIWATHSQLKHIINSLRRLHIAPLVASSLLSLARSYTRSLSVSLSLSSQHAHLLSPLYFSLSLFFLYYYYNFFFISFVHMDLYVSAAFLLICCCRCCCCYSFFSCRFGCWSFYLVSRFSLNSACR